MGMQIILVAGPCCYAYSVDLGPTWAWVKTPLSEFIEERSGPICCFPCKTITNTQKKIRFTIPEVLDSSPVKR